jgi:hypothetical protein
LIVNIPSFFRPWIKMQQKWLPLPF